MKRRLHVQTFEIRQPRKRREGLRIGTTRRPPRGVPRGRWQSDGYFELWFPLVAPSVALLRREGRKTSTIPPFDAVSSRLMRESWDSHRQSMPWRSSVPLHDRHRSRSDATAGTNADAIGPSYGRPLSVQHVANRTDRQRKLGGRRSVGIAKYLHPRIT
jgi:uncharacterized protein YeaO (DUF488 family)